MRGKIYYRRFRQKTQLFLSNMPTHPSKSPWFYIRLLVAAFIATILCLVFFSAVTLSTAVTTPLNNPVCCQTPADFGAAFENVVFTVERNISLAGWYLPSSSKEVIILVHSYYLDRRQTLPVAEMLYQNGYGVFMYDQRASGESQGSTRSLGWLDVADFDAAIQWVISRENGVKVGAYGCSMGAAIALAGAANNDQIRAVAVDAPSPLHWSENLPSFRIQDPLSLPTMALYYSLVALRSQSLPPTSTLMAVKNLAPRPILFFSTGQSGEFLRIEAYFEAASSPKSHFNLPDSNHCAGPRTHPQLYQEQLIQFFDAAFR
jgi:pimeloyl-ACP methyl ester carboxylesterase